MALEAIPVSENSGQSQSSVFELTSSAALIHTAASGTGFSELVYVWYAGHRRTRITFSVKNSSGVIMQSDAIYLDKDVPFVLNPEQSLELNVDGAQVIYVLARAERSTLSGASLPVTITVNGGAYSTASAGSSVDIPVEYESGGSEGISVVDGVVVVPDPDACDPASITVNGDTPALEVASGASQDIAVHDSAGADVGTRSGATVTIADADVNVNGSDYGSVVAEGAINVQVVDDGDNPVGSLSGGKWVVPVSSGPVGAKLMKTGQTTSYATGDDGDLQAGRDVDFYTLPSNNPFGNTNRFTDELGGSNYTNNIVIDWSTYDGVEVLGYYRVLSSASDWSTAINWALTLSVGSFTSGWRLANIHEIFNTFYTDGSNAILDNRIAPFNYPSAQIWTSTSTGNLSAWFSNNYIAAPFVNGNKASTYRGMAVRTFTVTGTTLS